MAVAQSPEEMARAMRRMATVLGLGAVVMVVIALVLLVLVDQPVAAYAVLAVAVLDLAVSLLARRAARRTDAAARTNPVIQEL